MTFLILALLAPSLAYTLLAPSLAYTPPPRRSRPARAAQRLESFSGVSFSTPSTLWPAPANLTQPVNPTPCAWSQPINSSYLPGCADGGYPCAGFPTLAQAQAACALDYLCGGVTSQDGGGPPWEPRHGTRAIYSGQGEISYLIANACHASSAVCHPLPPTFTISATGASNQVLVDAMARYTQMVNTAYAPTTTPPPGAAQIQGLSVQLASADDVLQFGVDESYTLAVSAEGALLRAATVWGALRGLETFSQLARHTWSTSAAGAVNASYNEVCEVTVVDAPRFPMRSLMLDTARHFMPVRVIKQVIDLASYLKLNSLRLHLIDTDAWSYYIPELPAVTNASAYTPLHVYYPEHLAELVAFGRARGVVVWPEVDFPFHSASILASLPSLGCLAPDGVSRMFIDPTFSGLWPTMGKVFGVLNEVFPPQYPFHMGGDEVDRTGWGTCPSVLAWAGAQGGDCAKSAGNCVARWWYKSLYSFLAAPPYSRTVFAWEDATDAVDAGWVGASTGGLVLEQWCVGGAPRGARAPQCCSPTLTLTPPFYAPPPPGMAMRASGARACATLRAAPMPASLWRGPFSMCSQCQGRTMAPSHTIALPRSITRTYSTSRAMPLSGCISSWWGQSSCSGMMRVISAPRTWF